MIDITLPRYDECRKWIRTARNHKKPWEEIKFDSKFTDRNLEEFLLTQVATNFWPSEIDQSDWQRLVLSEQESEEKSLEISEHDDKAVLIDSTQDTEVTVPDNPKSSWQLYKKHLVQVGFQEESVEEIEQATIALLKRLNGDTADTEPIKGLVIGHVQSGKTANMAALMAMAADWGWNVFIVLSGTIENLRKQTQKRILSDLNLPGNIHWIGLEHLSKSCSLEQRAQQLRLEGNSPVRYFTVCLKNPARLEGLIDWITSDTNKLRQMKVIVIDDEADQASINTADVSKDERTRINKLIVNLVEGRSVKGGLISGKAKAMNYISYTATPYANFLNECADESLYPKNFIRALKPSNEYFGPRQIFGIEETDASDGLNIIRDIPDHEVEDIKNIHKFGQGEIPESLKDSISWFLCAVAAMRFWGYHKPISMLVHTSQQQVHHDAIADAIETWICGQGDDELIERCRRLWEKEKMELSLESFNLTYPEYGRPIEEINDYPNFSAIETCIIELKQKVTNIELGEEGELAYHQQIHLCIDNCSKNGLSSDGMYVRLAYPDPDMPNYPKPAPAFIVVGGSTLSRGLTIEGLVSTYFLRSTYQADTLMQMGRWFGYRRGYELLPRIWMSRDTVDKFKFLASLEQELREDLKRYMIAGANPLEYGPRVKNSPKANWLRITAKNKMQEAEEVDIDYSGTSVQTILFENNKDLLVENMSVAEQFLNNLGPGVISDLKNSYVWKGIDFKAIHEMLLSKFNFHKRARVFNALDAFSEWVYQLTKDGELPKWNIILAGSGDINNLENQSTWDFKLGQIGKVTRSQKIQNRSDDILNIGVLRAPKDQFADIDFTKLPPEYIGKINNNMSNIEIESIRKEASCDNVPQLIIYCIDKDSKARQNSTTRTDLTAVADIMGICISIPGNGKSNGRARVLTIKTKKIRETENWEDEE